MSSVIAGSVKRLPFVVVDREDEEEEDFVPEDLFGESAERLKFQRKQAAIDNKAAADEAARKFRVVFGDQDAADAKPEDTTRNPPKAM